MDDAPELDPTIVRARHGRKGDIDRFVGLWLSLMVSGRQPRGRRISSQVRRDVEGFFSNRDVRAAIDAAGEEAVLEQLADAANRFWGTCLTDPQYSSAVLGMSRMEPKRIQTRAARDLVGALAVMHDSGAAKGLAAQLPRLLIDAYLQTFGEGSAEALRSAASKSTSAMQMLS